MAHHNSRGHLNNNKTLQDEEEHSDDDGDRRKQHEKNRFMLKLPCPEDFNEDGTLKFKPLSKLMLKLQTMKAKPEN